VEYLSTSETTRPRELRYGILREPPSRFFCHQRIVLRIAQALSTHVESRSLGQVAVAPLDVVLDRDRSLIVQPDVLFIASDRLAIVDKQVWGAPDLVVEVVSPCSAAYDRSEKFRWYQHYGVREYWIVDPDERRITVIDFTTRSPEQRVADLLTTTRSTVLPDLQISVAELLEGRRKSSTQVS
jgi:Uma2 family endonuclease